MTVDKKTLTELIDAYADAKVSRNQTLLQMVLPQLREAIDEVFGTDELEPETETESED